MSTTPLLMVAFKYGMMRAAGVVPTDAYKEMAKGLSESIFELLKLTTIKPSKRLAESIAALPSPWVMSLAATAAYHASLTLKMNSSDDLASRLEEALASFLEAPEPETFLLFPDSDTLLLEPEKAATQLAVVFVRLLESRGSSNLGELSSLGRAAEEVIRQARNTLSLENRAILIGIGRILRAVETETAVNPKIRRAQLPNFVGDLLEQTATIERRELKDGDSIQIRIEGQKPTLLVVNRPQLSLPREWQQIAEKEAQLFNDDRQGGPGLRLTHLEPRAVSFSGVHTDGRLTGESARPLRDHLDAWLQFATQAPLAIIGNPGSGKTTSCRWIVKSTFERWTRSGGAREALFPLLIQLVGLKRSIKQIVRVPAHAIGDELLRRCLDQISSVTQLPPSQRVLLVLDGFDELAIADRSDAEALLDGIGRLALLENIRVIITGRSLAFQPFWTHVDKHAMASCRWRRVELMPFRRGPGGECDRYIASWLLAQDMSKLTPSRVSELRGVAHTGGIFGNLAETPVLLTLICELSLREGFDSLRGEGVGRFDIMRQLVHTAIRWRANPHGSRSEVRRSEMAVRMRQYGEWAWRAVLEGGVAFKIDRIEAITEETADLLLVEFFFEDGGQNNGTAAFMHRTVAEFLAAQEIAQRLVDSLSGATTSRLDFFADLTHSVSRSNVLLDPNFQWYLRKHIASVDSLIRREIKDAAREWIDVLYRHPVDMRLRLLRVPTPLFSGVGAELALLCYLAASEDGIDEEVVSQAVLLRHYSPRSTTLWHSPGFAARASGLEVAGYNLAGFRFSDSVIEGLHANKANFANARFDNAELTDCNFSDAFLVGADLSRVVVARCTFEGATFDDVLLDEADFDVAPTPRQLNSCASIRGLRIPADRDTAQALGSKALEIGWKVGNGRFARWDGSDFKVI